MEAYLRDICLAANIQDAFFHHDPLPAECGSCLPSYTVCRSFVWSFRWAQTNTSTGPKKRSHVNRGHFPNDEAAGKLIYLALRNITAKWKMPPGFWKSAMNQFAIRYPDRLAVLSV